MAAPRTRPEHGEKNTFKLPRGEALRRAMATVYREQRDAILRFLKTGRKAMDGNIPHAWPDWHDFGLGASELSERMTPLLRLTWEQAADAFAPKVGLDPDSWSVVNPHTERMIEEAALNFCESTNHTTSLQLDRALAATRETLVEGVVRKGETLEQLTKRIMAIFDSATRSKARAIAQTETSRAVHAAQEQAAIASGVVTGWEWLASADACPRCIKIYHSAPFVKLGHAFAISGNNPHYSTVKFPPLHPFCNCSCSPVLDTDPQPQWHDTLHQPGPATPEEHGQAAERQQELIGSIFPGEKPKPAKPKPGKKPKPAPPKPKPKPKPEPEPLPPPPLPPPPVVPIVVPEPEPEPEPKPKPKPKRPKPTPAPPKKPAKPPEWPELSDLEVVRKLGGSTGAELVEDSFGRRFVRKKGGNAGHLNEEAAADALYRAMGIDVPKSRIYETAAGPVKLAAFHEGKTLGELEHSDPAAYKAAVAKLRKGFVADALLGNWDVIGMDADNVLVTAEGEVLRVDNGGSLRYRAQGGKKAAQQFGNDVPELASMRNAGINPPAAGVFGAVTDAEIKAQAKAIVAKKAEVLKEAPAELRDVLARRIEALSRYGEAAPEAARTAEAGAWKPAPEADFLKLDTSEAKKWGKRLFDAWDATLNEDEQYSVRRYTADAFSGINGALRGVSPMHKQTEEYIRHIDSALEKASLPEGIVATRYTTLKDSGIDKGKLRPGDDIPDPAYGSTSIRAGGVVFGPDRLEVRIPRGTHAAYLEPITEAEGEMELLLSRHTRYRVVEILPDRIVVEVVQSSP